MHAYRLLSCVRMRAAENQPVHSGCHILLRSRQVNRWLYRGGGCCLLLREGVPRSRRRACCTQPQPPPVWDLEGAAWEWAGGEGHAGAGRPEGQLGRLRRLGPGGWSACPHPSCQACAWVQVRRSLKSGIPARTAGLFLPLWRLLSVRSAWPLRGLGTSAPGSARTQPWDKLLLPGFQLLTALQLSWYYGAVLEGEGSWRGRGGGQKARPCVSAAAVSHIS